MTNPNKICFVCMRELPEEGAVCPSCGHDNRLRGNGPGFLKSSVLGGQYLTGKVLGRGGFGITYLGLDLFLDRKVAIKEYFPEGVVHRDEATQRVAPFGGSMEETFKQGVSRAVREARTAAQMEDIPNTVRIYSVLEANSTVYIVMEYIDGITLTAYVQQAGGKIPWVRAWPIIEPILNTLSKVHARGIVHRDVSPDNIMIRYSDTSPVLLDFGTARDITTGNTEHSISLRLGFSPMEMYTSSGAIDQRSDEYAVMATLYFMLTGKKPESPLNVAAGLGIIEAPSKLGSDIPSGEDSAEAVLMRGLECRMEDRYPTIEELHQAFHRALEQGATVISPLDVDISSPEKKRKGNEKQIKPKELSKDKEEKISIAQDNAIKKEDGQKKTQQKKAGSKKPVLLLLIIVVAAVAVFLIFFVGNKEKEPENLNNDAPLPYESADLTTRLPESTTPSPEPTTPSPEPTTPSPEPTTPSPEPTTPSPEPTTPSPEPTTPSPEPTTPLPESTTPSPEPTTSSPESTTPSPIYEADNWKCEICGAVMDKENKFCEECGYAKGKWICKGCGAIVDGENQFCEECGVAKGKWICKECGAVMDGENQFCEECGVAKGKWICKECGAVVDGENQFCEECGTKHDTSGNK